MAYNKGWYLANREQQLEKAKAYYRANRTKILERQSKYQKDHADPVRATIKRCRQRIPIAVFLWKSAKSRAKKKNLEFSIMPTDLVIPEKCPVFGMVLKRVIGEGKGGASAASPTLDRIDNTRGYTPDNVQVISWRANKLKSDGTLQEFETLVSYLKKSENQRGSYGLVGKSDRGSPNGRQVHSRTQAMV